MDLYDCEIRKLTSMLESHGVKRLPLQKEWEMTEKENLILKSETAYELGGGSSQAVSAIAFTQVIPHQIHCILRHKPLILCKCKNYCNQAEQ